MFINVFNGKKISNIEKIIMFFVQKGYTIVCNNSIICDDPSVFFVGAPISLYKNKMLQSEKIGKILHVQDVLRFHPKKQWSEINSSHFVIINLLSDYEYMFNLFDDYITILNDIFCVKSDRIYGSVIDSNEELINLWNKYLNINNLNKIKKSNNEDRAIWTYGNKDMYGVGITIKRNCEGSTCNLLNIGDAIIINVNNQKKYFEMGLGYERVMASSKEKPSVYDVEYRIEIIDSAVAVGFSKNASCQLLELTEMIYILFINGITINNKGKGYILKKALKMLFNILFELSSGDIDLILINLEKFIKCWSVSYNQLEDFFGFLIKSCTDNFYNLLKNYTYVVNHEITDVVQLYETYGINENQYKMLCNHK